ncbi:MAG: hypothetical protein R3190_17655, partial [Thermoanaerobaculia bacterium]|nr:hypothetical protein [Thermoanaerobaculia bacterium]
MIGFCMLAAVALAAAPALAIDCENIPTSAGPVSADLMAACGGQGAASRPQLDPTDTAIGLEGIGAECESMVLNNPAGAAGFGFIDFHPAADFAGSDFSALYAATFTNPTTIKTVSATDCSQATIGTCSLDAGHNPSGLAWDDSTGTMYLSSTDI